VTDPPSNLTVVRVNLTAVVLTWQPPAVTNNVVVEGYEIFYESSTNKLSDVVGNDTHEVIITFLQLNENYQMYVVAFGGDLPSTRSNAVNVSTEVNFYIPAVTPVIGETNVILSCRVTVNVPNLNFSVAWLDQEMNVIQSSNISGAYESTNSIANNTKSISLKFDSIEPRDGGKYTCIADFLSFNSINESYYLFIQGKRV
jgi:Tol biopolymer transport system component